MVLHVHFHSRAHIKLDRCIAILQDASNYRDLQKDAFDENTSSDIKKTRRWQLDVLPHVGEPPRVLSTDIRHAACCLT